jgi:hypothetical protein
MKANLPESRFFDFLLAINQPYLNNFEKWVFQPGMLFDSLDKWWGDKEKRQTAHEGIDLCCFKENNGQVTTLHKKIKIPATFSGTIFKTEKDFLGTSIYLRHNIFAQDLRQLYTIYGHTTPLSSVIAKQKVEAGEPIAQVSEFTPKGTDIPPHLHLSFAWVPAPVEPNRLTWQNLTQDPGITLIDPFSVLTLPACYDANLTSMVES